MKVALIYDEPMTQAADKSLPEDFGAEYEDAAAIAGLCRALEANGHRPIPIPFNMDFFSLVHSSTPDVALNIAEEARRPDWPYRNTCSTPPSGRYRLTTVIWWVVKAMRC